MAPFWTWIRIRLLTVKRIRIQLFTQCFMRSAADPDPGSKRFRIPDPRKRIKIFLTQKIVYKLSEIWFGMFIPDPDLDFFTHAGSRIQWSKRHQIPDPDPLRWWCGSRSGFPKWCRSGSDLQKTARGRRGNGPQIGRGGEEVEPA